MFEMIPNRGNSNHIQGNNNYFNALFDRFFTDAPLLPGMAKSNNFRVDVKEKDDEYLLEADLPGIKRDDISIDYNNNYLTVSAKRDNVVEDNSSGYVTRERNYGEFKRSFYIDNVKDDSIDASFKNGVLKIKLPKTEQDNNPRKRIDIH
ncbi:heat shock protein Hsp18 [Clostridium hydrogenum]|uniref:heat shock protein Hsp18 n=1 Tax=Clostridium hydrogenum TaxID=2855764 RepID=UPI001F1B6563|nr:heat shock protein Hsp18 [Clostridium hydrogenum]